MFEQLVEPVFKRVQNRLALFSVSERRVAKLCLSDPISFSSSSITTISRLTHVSKPTVVRFCKKLGYSGFSELRKRLKEPEELGFHLLQFHDSTECIRRIKDDFTDSAIESLRDFRKYSSFARFELCVTTLISTYSKNGIIYLVGSGTSAFVVNDACLKFNEIGVSTETITDCCPGVLQQALPSAEDSVVIVDSHGSDPALIQFCRHSTGNGTSVIAVTASGSELSKQVDLFLANECLESKFFVSPMNSRLLQHTILDVLYLAVALRIRLIQA